MIGRNSHNHGMIISQTWNSCYVYKLKKGEKQCHMVAAEYFRLFTSTSVYYVAGLRAAGGDCASMDALLILLLKFMHLKSHRPCIHPKTCLTHWGRVTHICVGNLTIIVSYNGLSPGRRQAIIWTNAGILLIGLLGTNFSEILVKIQTFSSKKMHSKMSSGK